MDRFFGERTMVPAERRAVKLLGMGGGDTEKVLDRGGGRGQVGGVAVMIYGPREIAGIRRACATAAATLASVGERLRPGVTTAQIDAWVREDTARRGGRPSQLGYNGFPAS